MKKVMFGFAPLLAVAAFAISPAAASAVTTYGTCTTGTHSTNCPTGEKFTEFTEGGEGVSGKKVSTSFVLEATVSKETITCTGLAAGGSMWNESSVGHSDLVLRFSECTAAGAELGAVCTSTAKINGNGTIEGIVSDKVKSETEVEVKIESGFAVKCGTTSLGNVTGSVVGNETAATSVLKFAKATGLTFATKAASITGEVEFLTNAAKKVYI